MFNNYTLRFIFQNLYGGAQLEHLPTKDFRWLEKREYNSIDWRKIKTMGKTWYILEVDLAYPEKLHEKHSNLPLAPENVEITFEDLSPYSQGVFFDINGCKRYKDTKLVGNFQTKRKYVLHFKNLKLYLQLGLKLLKIHRVLTFSQSRFIDKFITKCTRFRQQSQSKFEQDQFKKVANCVYGKTIQNNRKYIEVQIHSNKDTLIRALSDYSYKHFGIIDENLVQTVHSLKEIVHDKPMYVGFSILELSKHYMFDFYYNKLLNGLRCEIEMGMSDTDSFLFKVSNKDHFHQHIHQYMDYSNYPQDHPLYNPINKAKLGFFKDELAGKFICNEFIGLKSKCYSMDLRSALDGSLVEKKVCKGLGKVAIQNRLKFDHYKRSLFLGETKRLDFCNIRSKSHTVSSVRINKRAITHFDGKRWIFNCGIHSEPYGSKFIKTKTSLRCPKCNFK